MVVCCCRSLELAVRTVEGVINYTASCKIVKGAYNLSAKIFRFSVNTTTTLIGKVITPLSSRCQKNKIIILQRKDWVGTVAKTVIAALKTICIGSSSAFFKHPKYFEELFLLGIGEALVDFFFTTKALFS